MMTCDTLVMTSASALGLGGGHGRLPEQGFSLDSSRSSRQASLSCRCVRQSMNPALQLQLNLRRDAPINSAPQLQSA
jgi:hypothetical protein